MQLEELQSQWQRLDQKLDRSLALETELVRQLVVQPARRRVNRLAIWPAIDVAFCVGVVLLGGAFLSGAGRGWQVAAPACVVMIGAFGLLIDSVLQLQRVSDLDWTGPVAKIQGTLERLRVAKIRQFKWIMLLSPLVGFCAFMVGLHWLFEWLTGDRVNVLDKLDSGWIVANYAFGVLFALVGYHLARVLAQKCHRHPWWQSVLDGISGKSLKAAALDVDRWVSLQREESSRGD